MNRVLPVLFNTEMVRAILDGRKTVTRRICRDGNRYTVPDMGLYDAEKRTYAVHRYMDEEHECESRLDTAERPCPICPGDILYVRETWAFMPCIECMMDYDGKCLCNNIPITYEDEYSVSEGCFMYKADFSEEEKGCIVWRPSIHMPKQAARIWLKVTDVRVERLQEITEEQAAAEGAIDNRGFIHAPENEYDDIHSVREHFKKIWDSTIRKPDIDRYGWAANPWVWVIEFEQCEKPETCIINGIEPASDNRPCIGYQKSKEDDEPCEMCKGCKWCGGEKTEGV